MEPYGEPREELISDHEIQTKIMRNSHLENLGLFAVVATQLESVVETILLGLLKLDARYGGATVRFISFQAQKDLINAIAADLFGPKHSTTKSLAKLLVNASEVLARRNEQIHGHHSYEPEHVQTAIRKRGQLSVKIVQSTRGTMLDVIIKGLQTFNDLHLLTVNGSLPQPLPPRNGQYEALINALLGRSGDGIAPGQGLLGDVFRDQNQDGGGEES